MSTVHPQHQLITMAHLLAEEAYTLPIDNTPLPEAYRQELHTIREAAIRFYERLIAAQTEWAEWGEDKLRVLRHSLQNDLNTVVGFAHLQLHDTTSPLNNEQRTTLEYLYSRGRALASMINSLR